jgi:hypothetical protein
MKGGKTMTEGPIIQAGAVVFLRARHLTADGRNHDSENRDIARQRLICQDAAAMCGAPIAREYVEYGGTGPITRRPVVQRMLDELTTLPNVRYVITVSHDRLARLPSDFRAVEEALIAAGAHLVIATDLPRAYFCNPNEAFFDLTPTNDEPPRTKGGSW